VGVTRMSVSGAGVATPRIVPGIVLEHGRPCSAQVRCTWSSVREFVACSNCVMSSEDRSRCLGTESA
jgi:hypothetical protein